MCIRVFYWIQNFPRSFNLPATTVNFFKQMFKVRSSVFNTVFTIEITINYRITVHKYLLYCHYARQWCLVHCLHNLWKFTYVNEVVWSSCLLTKRISSTDVCSTHYRTHVNIAWRHEFQTLSNALVFVRFIV